MIPLGNLWFTLFRDINDEGDIVGAYGVRGGAFSIFEVHGFLLSRHGKITLIDYPVTPTGDENIFQTLPLGINNKGVITGGYLFATVPSPTPPLGQGFVRNSKGEYMTVNYPGARQTEIYKSSESGVLVGGWQAGDVQNPGQSNAFKAYPSKNSGLDESPSKDKK